MKPVSKPPARKSRRDDDRREERKVRLRPGDARIFKRAGEPLERIRCDLRGGDLLSEQSAS